MPASADCLQYLQREVQSGLSKLWECSDGRDTLLVITRVDSNPRELVIPLVVGSGLRKFAPIFLSKARAESLPVRIHTASLIVRRLCRWVGFRTAEYVMRIPNA